MATWVLFLPNWHKSTRYYPPPRKCIVLVSFIHPSGMRKHSDLFSLGAARTMDYRLVYFSLGPSNP